MLAMSAAAPEFHVGQWVQPEGMAQPGQIAQIDVARRQAQVQIGAATWKLPFDRLTPCDPPPESKKSAVSIRAPGSAAQHELDLHGLRVHEAIELLDKFLDNAILHHLTSVKVIHGHGSGRVRKAVRDHLARNPHVRDFHFGEPVHGGLAVTVVYLK